MRTTKGYYVSESNGLLAEFDGKYEVKLYVPPCAHCGATERFVTDARFKHSDDANHHATWKNFKEGYAQE